MSLEDTFKNYVQNITGAKNPASFIPVNNTLPTYLNNNPMAQPKTSFLQSVWAWCKKWLGLVVFLLVVGIVAIIIWKRAATSSGTIPPPNHAVFEGQPSLPVHENIENEYDDSHQVYSDDHDISPRYNNDEDDNDNYSRDGNPNTMCGLERVEETEEHLAETVGVQDDQDDFDKLLQDKLLQESKNGVRDSRQQSSKGRVDVTNAPSSSSAENDFDTLEELDNA